MEHVLAILVPWLRACPDLVVGDPTRLRHRSGGGRIVFEVIATPGRPYASAERVDPEHHDSDRPPSGARRRALPN
ncbi:hypothetical protein [Microbispora sp. NBRC 16548]|uniref:hypothetical protein n=1 Tax=Microbispora sp. NBRC 16548 TaxID=3030994 RepID=UPI0024A1A05D|nr:hypothetical protein [Microbispora sp. NBRC 16548]GLX06583.1 hypothetical protein Misp03_35100 [Microbispora sp. NBRC 16548]